MYPIQSAEMMYTQPTTGHTHLYTTDVSDVEATAAAAEVDLFLKLST